MSSNSCFCQKYANYWLYLLFYWNSILSISLEYWNFKKINGNAYIFRISNFIYNHFNITIQIKCINLAIFISKIIVFRVPTLKWCPVLRTERFTPSKCVIGIYCKDGPVLRTQTFNLFHCVTGAQRIYSICICL